MYKPVPQLVVATSPMSCLREIPKSAILQCKVCSLISTCLICLLINYVSMQVFPANWGKLIMMFAGFKSRCIALHFFTALNPRTIYLNIINTSDSFNSYARCLIKFARSPPLHNSMAKYILLAVLVASLSVTTFGEFI